MARKVKKTLLSTLIIVGEGACEKAFLSHLKGLYSYNTKQKIKLESADGGSPEDIVRTAIKKTKHIDYDRKFILMDSDISIDDKTIAMAKKAKITIILSKPLCLEGMLLNMLGESVPDTSAKCKSKLHPKLDGNPAYKDSYKKLITNELLESTDIEQIKLLISIIKNKLLRG